MITLASDKPNDEFKVALTGMGPAAGDGPVRFEKGANGDLHQHFVGKLKYGAMTLDFEGRSRNGHPTKGSAWLQRE